MGVTDELAAPNHVTDVSINAPINVEGSAGTPEQNADLARKIQGELENKMRGSIASELRAQLRPGAMIGQK